MIENEQDNTARADLLRQLVALRTTKKLRQIDVARAMGIGQPSVSEMERGDVNPRLGTLQKYARAIGAKLEFNIVEEDES